MRGVVGDLLPKGPDALALHEQRGGVELAHGILLLVCGKPCGARKA